MQKSKQEQEKHLQYSCEAPEQHYSRPMPDQKDNLALGVRLLNLDRISDDTVW